MYLKSSLSIFSFSKKGDNTCPTIRNNSLKAFVYQILKLHVRVDSLQICRIWEPR